MVIINELDLHKSKQEILMDLIYEATKQRFPLDKIVFGDPRELKTRPGDEFAPNTHIPVKVDVGYDRRYALPQAGLMYRRRQLAQHLKDINWDQVVIPFFPFKISDILDQINMQLSYPLQLEDLDDLTYDSKEQLLAYGLILQAASRSLLWCESLTTFGVALGAFEPNAMITVTRLAGFTKWMPEEGVHYEYA